MQLPVPAPSRLLPAMGAGFAGFTVWTFGDTAIRYLRIYPPEQIAFLVAIFTLAFVLCFAPMLGGMKTSLQKPHQKLQILRGLMLALSSVATFIAFTHLPMVDAFAIIFLSPIAAKLLSVAINRERIPPAAWIVSLVGFAGVLLVVRPGFDAISYGEAAALFIPVTFALGFVLARTIGDENMTAFSANIYVDGWLALITAVPTYLHFMPMAPFHLALILFIAATGAIGTILVTRAYARAPTAYVAPLHYTQIIWGVVWGILFFNEYPDAWTIAGASVIIISGVVLILLTPRA